MSWMVGWKGCKQIRILVYEKLKSAADGRPGGWPRCTAREVTWEKFLSIISKPLLGGGGVILCSGWWGTTTPPCVHSNSSRGADRDTRGSTVSRSAPHHQQVLSKAKTRFLAATKTRFLSGWQEDFSLGHYSYFWKTAKKGFLEKLWWRRWRSEAAPPRRLKTGC